MSRHATHARHAGRAVVVVAGYDRPLDDLFLQVFVRGEDDPMAGALLYTSLREPQRDWTDIDTVAGKLAELGIAVPQSLLEAVLLDQVLKAGNRIAWHPPRAVVDQRAGMQAN